MPHWYFHFANTLPPHFISKMKNCLCVGEGSYMVLGLLQYSKPLWEILNLFRNATQQFCNNASSASETITGQKSRLYW